MGIYTRFVGNKKIVLTLVARCGGGITIVIIIIIIGVGRTRKSPRGHDSVLRTMIQYYVIARLATLPFCARQSRPTCPLSSSVCTVTLYIRGHPSSTGPEFTCRVGMHRPANAEATTINLRFG